MKAVLLPVDNPGLLSPIYNWTSDYLIPIVNKPVAEHLVELLLNNDVREMIFILNHQPHETENYFKTGERWGCNISYSLVREYTGIIPSLAPIQNRLDEPFLCIPVNTVTNIDISSFINLNNEKAGDLTIPLSINHKHGSETRKSYPFIMSPEALSTLIEYKENPNLFRIRDYIKDRGLKSLTFSSEFDLYPVRSLNEYYTVNKAILMGNIKGINIPGKQIKKGVWVGRQSFIHPAAGITPPALIGSNCNVRSPVSLGECSVISNNVIIDSGSTVKRSIIYEDTFVGSNTEINDSIVRQNFIFNMPCMSKLYAGDDSILGNMNRRVFSEKINAVYNSLAGLALFIFFSPLIVLLYFYHTLFPRKGYMCIEKKYGDYRSTNMLGEPELAVIRKYYFRSKNTLIRKLPGLINVIKGEINLIGISTLSGNEVKSLTEEWQKVRFKAPTGLIHLWETEKKPAVTWEEKIISESYYASTRTFTGDILILLKFFFQRKGRKADEGSQPVSV